MQQDKTRQQQPLPQPKKVDKKLLEIKQTEKDKLLFEKKTIKK